MASFSQMKPTIFGGSTFTLGCRPIASSSCRNGRSQFISVCTLTPAFMASSDFDIAFIYPTIQELIIDVCNSPPESGGAGGGLNKGIILPFRPLLTSPNSGEELPDSVPPRFSVPRKLRPFRPPLTPPDSGGELSRTVSLRVFPCQKN